MKLFPYQDKFVNDKTRFIYVTASNQVGKVVDNREWVITIEGWKRNGDLKEGDFVYSSKGKHTKILKIFPHENWKFYKITFDDGSFVHVGLEHLWICKTKRQRFCKTFKHNRGKKKGLVYENPDYNQWVVKSTEEIIKSGGYTPDAKSNWSKVSIPVVEPIEFSKKKLLLDPYLLGLLIGDGCLANTVQMTTGDLEILQWLNDNCQGTIFRVENNHRMNITGIRPPLKELGLFGTHSDTKFIPPDYLLSSIQQRKELLKGLMDTDGSVYGKYSTLEYCTVSEKLKNDFVELINSLGGIVNKVAEKKPFYYNKERKKIFGKKAYVIRFKILFNPFKLQRKRNRWVPVKKYRHERLIEKIEFSHVADGTCILADSKDHSYLITKNFVVTHNTFAICVKGLHHALHVPNASVVIVSKSEQQAVMVLDEIKWLMKRARIDYSEQVGEIENRTELHLKGPRGSISVIRCFPPTTSVLGFPATLEMLDEINFWEKIGELSPIEYYDQVLEPRTNMTKSWSHPFLTMGQIIFISNPNGKRGIGWRTYSSDNRFNCYKYCWLAYPENTLEEYNEAKKRLPSYRFASIYAAEYVSAEGGFITLDQYNLFANWNIPLTIPPGSILFLGGDFGGEDIKSKNRDLNVLYGVVQVENTNAPNFPRIRVVYRKEWPSGTKKSLIYAEIARLNEMEEITIAKFAYDKVGVGDKLKNDLIDQGILSE